MSGPIFPSPLRREIIVLLCAKALALTAIYFFLVSPVARPEPDRAAMTAHLFSER